MACSCGSYGEKLSSEIRNKRKGIIPDMNTQHKLDKARPPRVHITYDLELGGAVEKKELPMIIGVIGEFAQEDTPLKERSFTHIHKDNFDAVLAGMKPALTFQVESHLPEQEGMLDVALQFSEMDDFSPDKLVRQVPVLAQLLAVREKLSDVKGRALGNDRLREQLDQILRGDRVSMENEAES